MESKLKELLKLVSDYEGSYDGAYNIRSNGQCAERNSTEHIRIVSKTDQPGLDIFIQPGTKGEKVFIPACVTQTGFHDLVYNDFHVGEDADVTIVAGCGIHAEHGEETVHNGIHRFFMGKNSHVIYQEKHIGTGAANADRVIDPVTEAFLEEDAVLEMDTVQLGGVDHSRRKTRAELEARAKILIRERIMTDGDETAETDFSVVLRGEDSGADLISRSVARGNSKQHFISQIHGLTRCTGHSECDAILAENGSVTAAPALEASCIDAALIHEAAIGKIAGEQILKLCTLGLTEQEAEERIIAGFLK